MTDKDTDTFVAGAIAAPFVFAFLGLVIVYDAFFTVLVWNLFMPVLFGLPKITIAAAIGLGCVAATFKPVSRTDKDSKSNLAVMFLKGPIVAAVAFVASHWL